MQGGVCVWGGGSLVLTTPMFAVSRLVTLWISDEAVLWCFPGFLYLLNVTTLKYESYFIITADAFVAIVKFKCQNEI